jgi:ribosomal protein uL23
MKGKKTKTDLFRVIKYPLSTEKAIRLVEAENKLIFIVDKNATKTDVKQAFEKMYSVKVVSVNMFNSNKGLKKAYVRLSGETPAIDLATKLGLI